MEYTKSALKKAIQHKLRLAYGCTEKTASEKEMVKACAMVLRDIMAERGVETMEKTMEQEKRKVHYLSLEFLIGRSLMKNAYNLGLTKELNAAIEELGFKAGDVFEAEPDAGLGNGGLGRLAACYLDGMTTLEIPATGYSICYELGLFKQKIVEGQQVELPDEWKDIGKAWLLERPQETEEVRFGGTIRTRWDGSHNMVVHEDYTRVMAVPYDMEITGYGTEHVNALRLWNAVSPKPVDMTLFSQGQYLRSNEERTMADAIAKILYPEDNHMEGKSLRLKQQYFFVSATIQSITRHHIQQYGTLNNFHEKNVIQINDTHPTMVIPELMRILIDDAGLSWDDAWYITTHSVAYTNHTVLAEALECWPQELFSSLLPRVWQIIQEIARRWQEKIEKFFNYDMQKVSKLAIIWDNGVRMANLCIAGGMAVNGVSALHSEILRQDVFKEACEMEPWKFKNVTNGVDHRRWLSSVNPELDSLIRELIGDEYLIHANKLRDLEKYADDATVLKRIEEIKKNNKDAFAKWAKKQQGVVLNPDAIMDVQAKRLHEYKRQLLNALHVIALYQQLQDNPNMEMTPQTFIFAAKAAPGYRVAKRIIRLINSLADQINNDPICKDKMQVFFMENYRVSMAEVLMPASEVSNQISTAGKEASGTGNMKFMMNGALTVGTLDGANVEMYELLGDENMFLFGLHTEEVNQLRPHYDPHMLYNRDPMLRRAVDQLKVGFRDGNTYEDLWQRLLFDTDSPADQYMVLADFAAYCNAENEVVNTYADRDKWNRMSLMNIARSGVFASDRSIADYADRIWNVPYRK